MEILGGICNELVNSKAGDVIETLVTLCCTDDCVRALMFAASKFARKLPAINVIDQDAELLSRVNAELQQYIVNIDNVKFVSTCLHILY